MLQNLQTSSCAKWGGGIQTQGAGESDERAVRSPRTARRADRRIAFARLRQRRNRQTAQDGPKNRKSSFQPAFFALRDHGRNQASQTRDPFISEAIMFPYERY